MFVDADGPPTSLFNTLDEARSAAEEFSREIVALGEPIPDMSIVKVVTVPIDQVSLRNILNKSGDDLFQTKEMVESVAKTVRSGAAPVG